jgi:hypothetical protein
MTTSLSLVSPLPAASGNESAAVEMPQHKQLAVAVTTAVEVPPGIAAAGADAVQHYLRAMLDRAQAGPLPDGNRRRGHGPIGSRQSFHAGSDR